MSDPSSSCPSDALPTLSDILEQDCPIDWWETSPIDLTERLNNNGGDDSHRFEWLSRLPRFGFPSEIGAVRTDWQSYVNGLAAMAAFTSILFVLWWIVLAVCKFTGKGGFLSGTLTPCRPVQIKVCRGVVVFSGVCVWIFSILLITEALESLKGVVTLVQETLPLAEEILHEAGNATTAYVDAVSESREARIAFFDNISDHCEFGFPVGRAEQAVLKLNDTLTKAGNFGDKVEGISNTILDTQNILDTVDDYLDLTRESLGYVVIIAVIIIDLMVLVFLVTVGLRWWTEKQKEQGQTHQDLSNHTKTLQTLQKLNCCLLPTFGFMLIFTYIFAIGSMVTSQLVSDLCVGDVNEKIKSMIPAPPVAMAIVGWYVGGCLWATRPGYVPKMLNEVVVPSLQQILEFGKNWLNETDVVGMAIGEINQVISNAGDAVSNVVETVGDTVSGVVETVQGVGETVTGVVDTVTNVVDTVTNVVDNVGDGAIMDEGLSTVAGVGQNMLNDTLSNVVDTVTEVVEGAIGEAQTWVNETVSTVGDTVTNVVDTATGIVAGVQDTLNETASNVVDSVANVVGTVTDTVAGAQDMVNQTVSNVVGAVETVSNVVGTVQTVSNAAGTGPVETVSTVVDTVQTVQTASNVAGAVSDAASNANGILDQAVSNVLPGERLLQQVLETVGNVVDKLPDPIADRLPDSLGVQCGFEVQAIERSWNFLKTKFTSVLRLGLGLLKTLKCGRINKIYYRLLHELTCEQGLTAMGQVFLWLFLLTLFSMIMVTCRAAWNPIVEPDIQSEEEGEKQDKAVMEEGDSIEPDTKDDVDALAQKDTNETLEASGTGITLGTFSLDGEDDLGEEVEV